jgi:hypothetical protein
MKIKLLLATLLMLGSASCVHQDLSKTLRYSYSKGEKIGVNNIQYQTLKEMKRGEAFLYRILYLIPIGDDSTMSAAFNGDISVVTYIGETGFWGFPFSKSCTVVYGA